MKTYSLTTLVGTVAFTAQSVTPPFAGLTTGDKCTIRNCNDMRSVNHIVTSILSQTLHLVEHDTTGLPDVSKPCVATAVNPIAGGMYNVDLIMR